MNKYSYATLRSAFHGFVSLHAYGSGITNVLSLLSPLTLASKLTNPVKSRPPLRSYILAPLIAILASLAFAATPALAELNLQRLAISARNEDGAPDVQAGSHPYALTTTFMLNGAGPSTGDLKDVKLELPPGFVGDPTATPRCTYQEFIKGEKLGEKFSCSPETAVGVSSTYLVDEQQTAEGDATPTSDPVYNLVPPAGVAAEFGFIVARETPILLQTSVRTGTDYGLTTNVPNINQAVVVGASKVTIWGVPAEASHDSIRGTCLHSFNEVARPVEEPGVGLREGEDEREGPIGAVGSKSILEPTKASEETKGCVSNAPPLPLLTNPTSCGASRTATLGVESWQELGVFHSKEASLPELSGCGKLDFSPTIGVKPDGEAGSTPTGLNVSLHVPQETTENPVGLAEADVKDTTVTLPAGVQLSPSAADGLQACAQLHGSAEPEKEAKEEKREISGINLETSWPANCPDASKIATVKIKTPLLEGELEGSVFLAAPQNFQGLPENPFSSLFALYLVAEEPKAGVLIKLAGKVTPDPVTGQITTTFENTPQLPFSDLKLEFYGTDRAPLATPAYCGSYKTAASLTPWTATLPGGTSSSAVSPTTEFPIASGPNGSSCTYPGQPLPFSPSLVSDTVTTNAGAFTPLDTTLSREDGQQSIQQVTLHYPAGLTGLLSGVALCGEAQANAGTCGPASEIGETIVSVGEGNDPFSVTGGKVFITGPYEGAPFGLSIENPAKAGPFYLQEGRPVVVRAKVEIDPLTAALTVTTNRLAQGYAIPTILDGVPLQIKHVDVNITRPGFTINPTNCAKTQVSGTVESAEKALSPVSIPFQVGECRSLAFAPKISFTTNGKTSKANGADLITKVTYPSGPQGTYADVSKVKVELPKQLPSRLTTLQKACTAAQFEANPAACPAASKIGYATVHTPLLPVPLTGPAIFVSHGGEAFPSLTMVLQGYGVTIDLVGTTFISKSGITSTTFKAVPDQPFSSFELVLPQGPFSALAANGNLCTSKLVMPDEFIGQNGALLRQDSTVNVEGCKPAITVTSHRVKGHTATLQVSVPAAGKLTASGKGLSKASKKAGAATTLTLKLSLTKREVAFLKKHHARRLKAKINLTFTPQRGSRLKTSTTVFIG